MLPSTESENRNTSCVAMPIELRSLCRSYRPTGTPSTQSLPFETSAKRGIRLTSEVLPEPVGPMIATVSPGLMSRVMSRSTSAPLSFRSTWSKETAPATRSALFTASARVVIVERA